MTTYQYILGEAKVTWARAAKWAHDAGATPLFMSLAKLYWEQAPERGVRPEVAYAQSTVETGFGRFGGVIDASYRNPAGMKIHAGGLNHDPHAHARFPTWACGVCAHLDHLALYAGAPGYPRHDTPDGRHFPDLLGTAVTVDVLAPKYATDPTYSQAWQQRLTSLLGR